MITDAQIVESQFASECGYETILLMETNLTEESPVVAMFRSYSEAEPHPWDMHYALELGFVSQGKLDREYRGCRRTLEPGQFWLCSTCEPHGWRVRETPCELTVMLAQPSMLFQHRFVQAPWLDLYAPFAALPAYRPQVAVEHLHDAFLWNNRLRDIVHMGNEPIKQIRLQLMLIEAILLLMAQWESPGPQKSNGPVVEQSISVAIQSVLGSKTPILTAHAASLCGMSRPTFVRAFQRLMGISFAQFELRHRIHGAAQSLLQTDEPLKAIASQWGFSDASHFIRRFSESYKLAPTEWRQNRSCQASEHKLTKVK